MSKTELAAGAFRVGVISDTHGHLDTKVAGIFSGVDHILHAGDIGFPALILELEYVAPVTAVLGNNDEGLSFKELEVVEVRGRKFIIQHIVKPGEAEGRLQRRIIKENPDVVIFGHTHKKYCEAHHNVLYFNPGYAGKPRFNDPRSVAILTCDSSGITAEFFEL